MSDDQIETLAGGLRGADRRALARAITLIESTRADHRAAAVRLLDRIIEHTGAAMRAGISGTPGVGKSTFIETLGSLLIERGHKVAVLTVDPSSARSGGSILGDKTRMQTLARRPEAFIRPSPSGTTLGGVARRTREAILLCEAAGFDIVLVETVGVGQSETAVADMTDLFVLLLAPGAGDELQGIKRGIVELADLLVINKADGDRVRAAERTAADYAGALRLLRPRSTLWSVPVLTCSALEATGVDRVWAQMRRYHDTLRAGGELERRRADQALAWRWAAATEDLTERLRESPALRERVPELEQAVGAGRIAPSAAARELVERFLAGSRR